MKNKVTIACTKRQKAIIIHCLIDPEGCLWPRKMPWCGLDPKADCRKCFEKNINWIITDERTKQDGR